jgi:formylglycine-generating enzyme required for sulfatase activity
MHVEYEHRRAHPSTIRAVRSAVGSKDVMASIPAGAFIMMGAAPDEQDASPNEYPQHEVSISAFELGVSVVTFEEYDGFCDATGRELLGDVGWGRERRPAINVSWEDAHVYCQWLNDWTGERFRLPSEAEWEHACRAGTATPWSVDGGEAQLSEYAWFSRNSAGMTHPVGEKRPNAFGLYDMHGNVWEWCADAWNDNYNNAPSDGAAWLTGDPSLRVLRGGSWSDRPQILRSAYRIRNSPSSRDSSSGFRVARTVLPR